jgi:hypothetical protein
MVRFTIAMTLASVHDANKERLDGDFDCVAEQVALAKMCRDETIQVVHIMGEVAACASREGIVNFVPASTFIGGADPLPDSHMVYFWHGRLYNAAYKRQGTPFSYGPYENQFYNRERVAEILARQKEALK